LRIVRLEALGWTSNDTRKRRVLKYLQTASFVTVLITLVIEGCS